MKQLVLPLCVFLLILAGEPEFLYADSHPNQSTNLVPLASYQFGKQVFTCVVKESELFRDSFMDLEKIDPPLSPRRAIQIAQQHASFVVTNVARFKTQEVTLKKAVGIWYYVVKLEPLDYMAIHYGAPKEPFKMVVLMGGTVAKNVVYKN